jgi:NitT/TauT family transport system permease protein
MMRKLFDQALFLAGLVLLWQVLHFVVGEVALSSPAATARRASELLASADFWPHAAETFLALGYALAVALVGGLAVGLAAGMHRLSGEVAEPILIALYSLPKITLYPVILLVFGLGFSAKVAFGAIHGIVPVTLFAMNAVRNINPVHFRTARALGLSRAELLGRIVLPGALPEIVSGVRIGFSLALLGVLIGEMFASQRGLGFLTMKAIGLNDVETMMAITLMLATVAVLLNVVLLALDRRLHHRAT